MDTIDMQKLRDALPKNGVITLRHNTKPPTSLYLECKIQSPSLSEKYPMTYEKDFEQILDWQESIIGKDNVMEFYTETTGHHWYVYLRRNPLRFINVTDEDIKTYSGYTVEQLKGSKITNK